MQELSSGCKYYLVQRYSRSRRFQDWFCCYIYTLRQTTILYQNLWNNRTSLCQWFCNGTVFSSKYAHFVLLQYMINEFLKFLRRVEITRLLNVIFVVIQTQNVKGKELLSHFVIPKHVPSSVISHLSDAFKSINEPWWFGICKVTVDWFFADFLMIK